MATSSKDRTGPRSPAEVLRARGKLGPYTQPAGEPATPAAGSSTSRGGGRRRTSRRKG